MGCNFEGYLQMVDGLVCFTSETIYLAKDTMTPAEGEFVVFM